MFNFKCTLKAINFSYKPNSSIRNSNVQLGFHFYNYVVDIANEMDAVVT